MVKKCNGQDIFLSGGGGDGGGRSMRSWGGDRSRTPPRRGMGKGGGKFGGRDDYGKGGRGGYSDYDDFRGKGSGKYGKYDRYDKYDMYDDGHEFEAGYLAGIRKGMSKGAFSDRSERASAVYANFGDRKGKGKGKSKGRDNGPYGGGKGKGRQDGGRKGGGKGKGDRDREEPSGKKLDDELTVYFGGKVEKTTTNKDARGKKGEKEEPKGADLDDELAKYMGKKEEEAAKKDGDAEKKEGTKDAAEAPKADEKKEEEKKA